jgi:hypothetical protein
LRAQAGQVLEKPGQLTHRHFRQPSGLTRFPWCRAELLWL